MNQEQFLYWLQGMLEYMDIDAASEEEMREKLEGIRSHLETVFVKVTKPRDDLKGIPEKGIPKVSPEKVNTPIDLGEAIRRAAEKGIGPKIPRNPNDIDFEKWVPKYDPNDRYRLTPGLPGKVELIC